MADDWIKMRGALIDHPKVIAMTRLLHRDNDFRHWLTPGGGGAVNGQIVSTHALRCVTTALLMRVWSVARATGKFVDDDLHLPHSTIIDIDEIAGAPGVGVAMHVIGWLVETDDKTGVYMPNFVEFNVPMTNAEKQKEYRLRQKNREETLPKRSNENAKNVTSREEGEKEELSNESSSGSGAQRAPAAKRGTRLPETWKLTRALYEWATGERPDVDPKFEARKFFDHWTAKAGAGATKLDWDKTFRNWIRNSKATPGFVPQGADGIRFAFTQPSRQAQAIGGLLTSNTEDTHDERDSRLVLTSDP